MFIQIRTITVKEGYAEQVTERFSGDSPMDKMEGLLDRTIMVNRKKQEHEEVVVMVRWESIEAWKNWEKSDVHIQGHRENRGKPKPDYIISTTVNMYEVAAVKPGTATA
ncbi:heme-degrading monooxygenase HmoA [Xylanibacillus composti]|uniref:Heme-degrading monooxygenase HmoA n=1 Tax=Xylanibacillus composti TaxID=1572762 RepID=A0A8J4M3X0_9BACL|nr:antibiotic biosynthesis monooxygenase [Xylanibacillus composti]GIQ70520.1 heme-degrading monooxygenase HmoA [Xylanibacillus composti]